MALPRVFRRVPVSASRALPRQQRQIPSFRLASGTSASQGGGSSSGWIWAGVAALAAGAGGYYALNQKPEVKAAVTPSKSAPKQSDPTEVKNPAGPKKVDYQAVYNDIAELLDAEDYDDGSYGPVLVRLAWHCSGTYDKNSKNGGSNGATMRFHPEASHGANAGLVVARDLLEQIKRKYGDDITYSDLWTLAGICAIQEMGGPHIKWRPGRQDGLAENCTPDGRLPDGDKGADHLRNIFYRQGFNDQEIVALSGAHALGRCHRDRSGFEGPWGFSPTMFTNDYYQKLLEDTWKLRQWDGPPQYQDQETKSLMMLLTDMALIQDKAFRPYVDKYAADQDLFFKDFSKVFAKLLENGVPRENFKSEPFTLTKTEDQ